MRANELELDSCLSSCRTKAIWLWEKSAITKAIKPDYHTIT